MSPKTMTAAEVAGLAAEKIQENLGVTPEELREMHAAHKLAKESADKAERKYVSDVVHTSMAASYAKEASNVIRNDPNEGIGLRMGALVRAAYLSKLESRNIKDVAKGMGYDWLAADLEGAEIGTKTNLVASQLGSGGAFVPPAYSEEFIALLRAAAVVRSSGVKEMPMPNGTMIIPRQATAGTAAYAGETANITASYLTSEQITMMMRKLTSLTTISNDLIKVSSPAVDQIVRDDLVQVMALKEDITFLRGDGTQFALKGMLSRINSGNQFARTQAGSVSTLAEITNDLFKAMSLPSQNNVPTVKPAWFFHKKTEIGLRRLRDSFGNLVFNPEMQNGTLFGVPFYVSNQIPTNLGSGTNKTEVYYLETSQAIIADTYAMELAVFPNGSYNDGSVVQSGISQDITVVRAISAHDFALRHDLVGSVINTIDWGN